MDGNGRWAKQRGLKRTEGHARGEDALFDVIEGAIEMGIPYLSAYAFSTENWKRSPDEVRWLMGFNRDVIHRRRDQLDAMGVRIRWAGRHPKLWKSVIKELESAEQQSADNTVLTLQFCVNYGGRAEIVDAVRDIARLATEGKIDPDHITEKTFRTHLDEPEIPDVDLFWRSSGEQHIELPVVAIGLRRDGVLRRAVARRRSSRPVGRRPGVREAGPQVRWGRPQ